MLKPKISFFMPVNLANEFLEFLHNEALLSQLFARTLMQLGSTIFKAKILKVAFFNSEFLIVSVVNTAPESPTTLVTLFLSVPLILLPRDLPNIKISPFDYKSIIFHGLPFGVGFGQIGANPPL